MNCKHVEGNLKEYLSETLEPVLHEMIKSHVEDCTKCQEMIAQEQSLSDFLKQADSSLSVPSISKDLFNKMKDIDQGKAVDQQQVVSEQSIPWKVRWMLLFMVIFGGVVIGLMTIPFKSKLNQKHVGNVGGPGYTWLGEFPEIESDPFELNGFSVSEDNDEFTPDPTRDRVEHTLEFDDLDDILPENSDERRRNQ